MKLKLAVLVRVRAGMSQQQVELQRRKQEVGRRLQAGSARAELVVTDLPCLYSVLPAPTADARDPSTVVVGCVCWPEENERFGGGALRGGGARVGW